MTSEKEGPPDMDALSLDSGDEGVMIGDKEDMFASALGDPPQVLPRTPAASLCVKFSIMIVFTTCKVQRSLWFA